MTMIKFYQGYLKDFIEICIIKSIINITLKNTTLKEHVL